ncbi:MAG: hypothetical protein ACM3XM_16960 [Mycobacterium leprae]
MSTYRSVGQILQELDRFDTAPVARLVAGVSVRPVQATMVEKRGVCDLPQDTVLTFAHPGDYHPEICPGLMRTLRPFILAEALGVPSGEAEGYVVSCPGKKGTVWQIQAAPDTAGR